MRHSSHHRSLPPPPWPPRPPPPRAVCRRRPPSPGRLLRTPSRRSACCRSRGAHSTGWSTASSQLRRNWPCRVPPSSCVPSSHAPTPFRCTPKLCCTRIVTLTSTPRWLQSGSRGAPSSHGAPPARGRHQRPPKMSPSALSPRCARPRPRRTAWPPWPAPRHAPCSPTSSTRSPRWRDIARVAVRQVAARGRETARRSHSSSSSRPSVWLTPSLRGGHSTANHRLMRRTKRNARCRRTGPTLR
mmetsp:Transcript_18760/g.56640  ORF Transcript_18760/g.56640 Transcript_18760/m.56640 type:complete len:243 (+) Transcript_18760:641-1369(+)